MCLSLLWGCFKTGSNLGCPQTCYVAKGSLEILILLPLSAKCWDYRHAPPSSSSMGLRPRHRYCFPLQPCCWLQHSVLTGTEWTLTPLWRNGLGKQQREQAHLWLRKPACKCCFRPSVSPREDRGLLFLCSLCLGSVLAALASPHPLLGTCVASDTRGSSFN